MSLRTIGKFGLLLVVIGFFMPIACDLNGFQLADHLMKNNQTFNGLLFYLLFASAIAGVVIGVLLLKGSSINPMIDWIVIAVCIASSLFLYFKLLKDFQNLQNGAYLILTGLIVALALQIISFIKKE